MTNEEKIQEICGCSKCVIHNHCEIGDLQCFHRPFLEEMAEWKDKQSIEDLGGWKTEPPTFDCYCLIETDDFPKNCRYIVAKWDDYAEHFYSESDDEPVSYKRYKIIHKA